MLHIGDALAEVNIGWYVLGQLTPVCPGGMAGARVGMG